MNTAARFGILAPLLVALPVGLGVLYSAGQVLEAGGSGAELLRATSTWRSVGWSVWAAAASTLIASVAAALVAILFRGTTRGDRVARGLAVLPLPMPHVVAALTGLLLLGQSGLLARAGYALGLLESPAQMPALTSDPLGIGFILVLAAKELPFLALIAFSALGERAAGLEESARSLGASPTQIVRLVTLPILWRGMLPGAVAVFAFVFGNYEVAALLGPSSPAPLPVLIMERYLGPSLGGRADAHLLSLLALAVTTLAVIAHEVIRRRVPWSTPS